VLSFLYVPLAAELLRRWGSEGLVLANTLNLLARVAYSCAFLRRATDAALARAAGGGGGGRPRLVPHVAVLGALGGSSVLTLALGRWLGTADSTPLQQLAHVGAGGLCLLGVAGAVLKAEPELLRTLRAARRGRADHDE
jgi:hypothetical protein